MPDNGGFGNSQGRSLASAATAGLLSAADYSFLASIYRANVDVSVDNAFDPRVTGLVGPIGCKCQTFDGTKWFRKYGSANTDWERLDVTEHSLNQGPDLTDAPSTLQPATDRAGEYSLPSATLTENRSMTIGVTGPPRTGAFLFLARRDLTAYTWTIVNGGAGAGTLCVFPASLTGPLGAWLYFDGTNWSFVGWAELLR
jgi:hypothetical protein